MFHSPFRLIVVLNGPKAFYGTVIHLPLSWIPDSKLRWVDTDTNTDIIYSWKVHVIYRYLLVIYWETTQVGWGIRMSVIRQSLATPPCRVVESKVLAFRRKITLVFGRFKWHRR